MEWSSELQCWCYTADEKEPDCMRCANVDAPYNICDKCGPAYGWQFFILPVKEVKDNE